LLIPSFQVPTVWQNHAGSLQGCALTSAKYIGDGESPASMMLCQCLLLLFWHSVILLHVRNRPLCTEISPESVNKYLVSDAGHAS
jgi:hypothetical protein